jgi:hypothetical protein
MITSSEFFLKWEIFRTKAAEKIKMHIMFDNFSPEKSAVYETM